METGPKPYWRIWDRFVQGVLVDRRLIEPGDTGFYRIVDSVEEAVGQITDFYRVFQSSRIVGDHLVFRLTRALTDVEIGELQQQFEDILKGPLDQAPGPVPQELNECPELPRLIIPFARSSYSRLRRLIDRVNSFGGPLRRPRPLLGLGALLGELAFRADPGAHDDLGLIVAPQCPRNEPRLPAPRTLLRPRPRRQLRRQPRNLRWHDGMIQRFRARASPAPSCFWS